MVCITFLRLRSDNQDEVRLSQTCLKMTHFVLGASTGLWRAVSRIYNDILFVFWKTEGQHSQTLGMR